MISFAKACFSPYVPDTIRRAWSEHGGTACTLQQATSEQHIHFFCYGRTDPWFIGLSEAAIAVFHAQWIVKVVEANFMLPIAPFVLNSDRFASSPIARCNSSSPHMHVMRHQPHHSNNGHLETTISQKYTESSHERQNLTTPSRQILAPPESPPAVSSAPTMRTYNSHFESPRSIKKPRLPAQLAIEENTSHSDLSSLTLVAEQTADTTEERSHDEIGPDSSGDTLVAIPHINLLDFIQKKRKPSPHSRIARPNPEKQKKRLTIFPPKQAVNDKDLPIITMAEAWAAVQYVQIKKAGIIGPHRPHLGKKFDLLVVSSAHSGIRKSCIMPSQGRRGSKA